MRNFERNVSNYFVKNGDHNLDDSIVSSFWAKLICAFTRDAIPSFVALLICLAIDVLFCVDGEYNGDDLTMDATISSATCTSVWKGICFI
mmetsp:Transcript_8845/g.12585  ORF Transcript_8845/g.12585 Transcript_8845/m.12585 type:complete len:90 (+) Transcript_8845:123-392(+)